MTTATDRSQYFKEYRKRNRQKLNAYARNYLKNPEHKAKHKDICHRYYIERKSNQYDHQNK